MLKIRIINIYIGQLPEYFPVWLESCKRNPTIDFLLFTNEHIEVSLPNVECKYIDIEIIKQLVFDKLNLKLNITKPFKLCDLKPAYGFLFQEFLNGYDYWGHCDLDVVWGDLRYFIQKYKLENYDKFLPMGHLSLYKNSVLNNLRFMEENNPFSNYERIYLDERNFLFDEIGIINIYKKNNINYFEDIIYADINPLKKRYTMCTYLKYYQSIYKKFVKNYFPVNCKKQIFMWEKNKIFQYFIDKGKINKREFMYIHIQKRSWKLIGQFTEKMIISDNVVKNEEVKDINFLIFHYNRYKFIYEKYESVKNFIQHCWSYAMRKILKIKKQDIVVEKSQEKEW